MTDSDKATPVDANGLERTLSKRSALYDADGDGKLSPIEEICKKYDT